MNEQVPVLLLDEAVLLLPDHVVAGVVTMRPVARGVMAGVTIVSEIR